MTSWVTVKSKKNGFFDEDGDGEDIAEDYDAVEVT